MKTKTWKVIRWEESRIKTLCNEHSGGFIHRH